MLSERHFAYNRFRAEMGETLIKCATFCLLIVLTSGLNRNELAEELCGSKCRGPVAGGYLEKYCNTSGLHLQTRCCYNHSTVVGLDLHNCNIDRVPEALQEMPALNVLLLHENPSLKNITDRDFMGLTHLQYLSLPAKASCPGGATAWETTSRGPSGAVCEKETDSCVENAVECPNNSSHCVHVGPGMVQCLCNTGFHGYKCLQEGNFPFGKYFGILAGVTAGLSSILFIMQGSKKLSYKRAHRQS